MKGSHNLPTRDEPVNDGPDVLVLQCGQRVVVVTLLRFFNDLMKGGVKA